MGVSEYKWLFLDLNSYFASAEQQDKPELRGKPVAVVPMMSDGTCAIAASYAAKAFGIKTGTKIYEAKQRCPDLICVLARHDVYVEYHHRILKEVDQHIPITKVCSIDEMSCRIPVREQNREAAIALATRIKQGILRNVGECLTCSVGIAPNSFLAKVASDRQKPDGLVVFDDATLPDALYKLKLTDLPGISTRMESHLNDRGVRTMRQFMDMAAPQARRVWGSVNGEKMWRRLHGEDIEDAPTQKSSIGHSRVLDSSLKAPDKAWDMARKLTLKAAGRLRTEDFFATLFDLSVRSLDGRDWQKHMKISPGQDNFAFLKALDTLWSRMLVDLKPDKILKVSVSMSGLCRRQEITPDLFDHASQAAQKLQRDNSALTGVMDQLNRRYGADTVQLGIMPKTSSGHVGTKIAFGRIPDAEEFLQ